jgi:hypothetical protein
MSHADTAHPAARRQAGAAWTRGAVLPSLMLFLAGSLLRVDVYAIGRISLGELILVVLSVGYWGQVLAEARQIKAIRVYLMLLSLWTFAILLSDFVNHTGFDLFFRGVARPLVIVSMFVACFGLLRKHPRALLWFFFGLVVSAFGNLIFETDFRVSDKLDKVTYGYAAFVYTPLIFALTTVGGYLLSRYKAVWPTLLFLAVSVFVSERFSRTTAASFLVAVLLYHVVLFFQTSPRARQFTPGAIAVIVIAGLIGAYIALQIYVGLAIDGIFGDRIAAKVALQTRAPTGDAVANMFLSARYGLVSNFLMMTDSPFVGAGSWPIEGPYVVRALQYLHMDVSPIIYADIISRRGTGHSILFGNWANYGPLVAFFWVYIFIRTIVCYKELLVSRSRVYWLVAPYLVTFLFSIPFNNLNSLNRVFTALIPAAMIVLSMAAEQAGRTQPAHPAPTRAVRRLPGTRPIDA